MLGECKALAHLDLSSNEIGDEGAGRLAGVLGLCKALAHLDLSYNEIWEEGAGRCWGSARPLHKPKVDSDGSGGSREAGGGSGGVQGYCSS